MAWGAEKTRAGYLKIKAGRLMRGFRGIIKMKVSGVGCTRCRWLHARTRALNLCACSSRGAANAKSASR
jgi:hypothetical protein